MESLPKHHRETPGNLHHMGAGGSFLYPMPAGVTVRYPANNNQGNNPPYYTTLYAPNHLHETVLNDGDPTTHNQGLRTRFLVWYHIHMRLRESPSQRPTPTTHQEGKNQ